MTSDRYSLIAFLGILVAICFIASVAAFLAWHRRYAEALGFGGLTTGLVGVLGTFRPKGPPLAATNSGDVNIPPASQ